MANQHMSTIEQTISGSFGGTLNLPKIFDIGVEAGYSYT